MTNNSNHKRLECVITGRVQMVMFRDFAQRNARKLGITGCVENLKDGSVKVIAEGDEDLLKQFVKLLAKGSFLAKVLTVKETWSEAGNEYTEFNIVYKDVFDRI